ncbi:hypothetical protein O5Y_28785 [Rhodococcus erythropolis CCM2595]|uniref:hypothetical protein n=1 Tax=Rhodococcus erythropolis TaxID=1833 RepID=UPI00038DCE7B|nr:hypothetical protein [Rhodococcus erythropolis]AGT95574.1 hypothetical protein O5Y_28785 [Rhodococcus erythropolis CCM2595]MBY6387249.1 hypothetical protein [Rhodococcus erythropolis]OXM23333.1 hypothetical protein CBI33_08005 [Rhodococcus erythropolis]
MIDVTGRISMPTRCAAVIFGVLIALAGCAKESDVEGEAMVRGVSVNRNLTESLARQSVIRYLTDTLAQTPSDAALSRQHPQAPSGLFGNGTVLPCIDDDTVGNRPLNVIVKYWVVGIPPGKSAEYFDTILRVWQDFGWKKLAAEGGLKSATARTSDGYAFDLSANTNGDLIVSASSPCFPASALGGEPFPLGIVNPNR